MKKKILIGVAFILAIFGCFCGMYFQNEELDNSISTTQNIIQNEIEKEEIQEQETYKMSQEEIEKLPTTEIIEQTEEQENALEQEIEDEGFELQGEIAYNGTSEYPTVAVGSYKGLTYYSQIDARWSNHPYTSVGNPNQTIGSSGCGPTCASMVVTAIKGTITPDTMGDLYVENGYRSADNGTYFSAFRFTADVFDIEYEEAYRLDDVINLLNNNHYVIASCGNGLFTTGGHFILLVGIENDHIKIYDPYLYAGKFDTSTRRGKVLVDGNTVYCPIENFREYANYTKFFAYKYEGNIKPNVQPVTTETYTRYVSVRTSLNVRNAPDGDWIGSLYNGDKVTVYETSDNWSRIGENRWVCSDYLVSNPNSSNYKPSSEYSTGTYVVRASVLNVRTGPSTGYHAKSYWELSYNARQQNSRLGNYYTNGYKYGVVCTVSKINGNWGYTPSGWICLDYCYKR